MSSDFFIKENFRKYVMYGEQKVSENIILNVLVKMDDTLRSSAY